MASTEMYTLLHYSVAVDEQLDMEVGMGLANKLEEMRKEGGDQWLSIWNADATKVGTYIMQCIVCSHKGTCMQRERAQQCLGV